MTTGRTLWAARAAALAWCALIFVLSSRPLAAPGWLDSIPLADKVAHFLIYAALAWFTARALSREPGAFVRGHALILAAVWAALYGASDEWHQSFVPGRTPALADWAADVLGAAAAMTLCAIMRRMKNAPPPPPA